MFDTTIPIWGIVAACIPVIWKQVQQHFTVITLKEQIVTLFKELEKERDERKADREAVMKRFEEVQIRFIRVDENHTKEMRAIGEALNELVKSNLNMSNSIEMTRELLKKEIEYIKERNDHQNRSR